jgi:hypothetical protein
MIMYYQSMVLDLLEDTVEYIQFAFLILGIFAAVFMAMGFGFKACPKCKSRFTTLSKSEASRDSHFESWFVDKLVDCHSCGKTTIYHTEWSKSHPDASDSRVPRY